MMYVVVYIVSIVGYIYIQHTHIQTRIDIGYYNTQHNVIRKVSSCAALIVYNKESELFNSVSTKCMNFIEV